MATLSQISITREHGGTFASNKQIAELFKRAKAKTLGNPNNPNAMLLNQLEQQKLLINAQKDLTLNQFQVSLSDLKQQVLNARRQNRELQAQTGLVDRISQIRDANQLADQVDYSIGKLLNQSLGQATNIAVQQEANLMGQVQATIGAATEIVGEGSVKAGIASVDHLKRFGDFVSGAFMGLGVALPGFGILKGVVGGGLRGAGSRFGWNWATKAGDTLKNVGVFRYGSQAAKSGFYEARNALKAGGAVSINGAKASKLLPGLGKASKSIVYTTENSLKVAQGLSSIGRAQTATKAARALTAAKGLGKVGVGLFSGWGVPVALASALIGGLVNVFNQKTPYYLTDEALNKIKNSDTIKGYASIAGISVDDFGNMISNTVSNTRY